MFSLNRNTMANIERCMSCISKLGAPSMSRSSTATGSATPGQGPNWSVLSTEQNYHPTNNCSTNAHSVSSTKLSGPALDRMSVCSSHGSFGSSSSEYSVPRMSCAQLFSQGHDAWYERIPSPQLQQCCSIHRASSPSTHCKSCTAPARPPKPISNNGKPPMALPIPSHSVTITNQPGQQQQHQFVGPYENYDIPKMPIQVTAHMTDSNKKPAAIENYDTPKKIQEYLTKDMNLNGATAATDMFANYDVPANVNDPGTTAVMCGCLGGNAPVTDPKPNKIYREFVGPRMDCTCKKVMSWADTWITLPYCRRGNGIENTGVPINKVRLSGEGKMPVVQPSGELAIYATVDMTKKIKKKLFEEIDPCECPHDDNATNSTTDQCNYINIQPQIKLPVKILRAAIEESVKEVNDPDLTRNYMNLNFAMSLENYENAKEVLQKVGVNLNELEETLQQCTKSKKICQKCGHASKQAINEENKGTSSTVTVRSTVCEEPLNKQKPEDYLLMEPGGNKSNYPGYLSMLPATTNGSAIPSQTQSQTAEPIENSICKDSMSEQQSTNIPIKAELMKRILNEKSASNPSIGPAMDRNRKRADQEARVPGSAMMLMHNTGSNPYTRKQIMNHSDLIQMDKRLTAQKRSSSVDSSRFFCLTDTKDSFGTAETLRKSLDTVVGSSVTCFTGNRRASSPCLYQERETRPEFSQCSNSKSPCDEETEQSNIETGYDTSHSIKHNHLICQSVYIRRSASVPCKAQNRDSSSSNDSGVSTGSMRQRTLEYTYFEVPSTTTMSNRIHEQHLYHPPRSTVHASLPRRSKSFDPLREITFQFQRNGQFGEKSSSAEAEIPICNTKRVSVHKNYNGSNDTGCLNGTGTNHLLILEAPAAEHQTCLITLKHYLYLVIVHPIHQMV